MKNPTKFFLVCALLLAGISSLHSQTVRRIDNTQNAGKVEWLPRQFDLDTIAFGIPKELVYEAKNISQDTLRIVEVQAGCHCTAVDWDKEPIPPGSSGKIKVTFDAAKEGRFYKLVAVKTNFDPEKSLALTMTGAVAPEKKAGQKQ